MPSLNKRPKFGMMVVYRSMNAEGPWEPVHSKDMPDFIKNNPRCMGRLVRGYMAQHETDGGYWYRAEIVDGGRKVLH